MHSEAMVPTVISRRRPKCFHSNTVRRPLGQRRQRPSNTSARSWRDVVLCERGSDAASIPFKAGRCLCFFMDQGAKGGSGSRTVRAAVVSGDLWQRGKPGRMAVDVAGFVVGGHDMPQLSSNQSHFMPPASQVNMQSATNRSTPRGVCGLVGLFAAVYACSLMLWSPQNKPRQAVRHQVGWSGGRLSRLRGEAPHATQPAKQWLPAPAAPPPCAAHENPRNWGKECRGVGFAFGSPGNVSLAPPAEEFHGKFDVVITWINNTGHPSGDPEMLYLLRSIERFGMAPHVRLVHVVLQGEPDDSIPHYLNRSSPTLRIHKHSEIFPDESHLPTESRQSILVNLVNIPGLAELFLYLNDDMFLVSPFRLETLVRSTPPEHDLAEMRRRYPEDFLLHKAGRDEMQRVPAEAGRRVAQLVQYTNDHGLASNDACAENSENTGEDIWYRQQSCAAEAMRSKFGQSLPIGGEVHAPTMMSATLAREVAVNFRAEVEETSKIGHGGCFVRQMNFYVIWAMYTLATTPAVEVRLKKDLESFSTEIHVNADPRYHFTKCNLRSEEQQASARAHFQEALRAVQDGGAQWLNLQGPGISSDYEACEHIREVGYEWLGRMFPTPSRWEVEQLRYPIDQPHAHLVQAA